MAGRVAVWVPGMAGRAGVAPSMVGGPREDSVEGWRAGGSLLPRRARDLLMVVWSVGKLAREWKTALFLIRVYTRLLLPESSEKKEK